MRCLESPLVGIQAHSSKSSTDNPQISQITQITFVAIPNAHSLFSDGDDKKLSLAF